MTRISTLAWMLFATLLLGGCGGADPDTATEETSEPAAEESGEGAAPAAEVASYAVPELTSELGKQLVASIAELEGVDSARVDEEKGLFLVTFQPGKTDPAAVLTKMQTVSEGATLEEVAAASADKKGCGGCPSKSKCPKAKAAEAAKSG